VAEIIAVGGSGESHTIEASTLFEQRDGELRATGRFPLNDAKYRAAGISLASILAVGER
jgi:pilus assembly protein CpaF